MAWPATGRLATSHLHLSWMLVAMAPLVGAIRRDLASSQHPATKFRVLQRRLQRSHHAATILQLSCCISTETAPAQWRHYTISIRAAGRERLCVHRTIQSSLRRAARPGWPMAAQSTQLFGSDDRLVRRAIAQSAKIEPPAISVFIALMQLRRHVHHKSGRLMVLIQPAWAPQE